jgi:tricorn protease
LFLSSLFVLLIGSVSAGTNGYYQYPAVHDDTLLFTVEGDIWTVGLKGGQATRVTTHPLVESHGSFSPDGSRIAFSASYEGPKEVYEIPVKGGQPTRVTWNGTSAVVRGYTPSGDIAYSSRHNATLPDWQLHTVSSTTGESTPIPLAQADEASWADDGTLIFTRLAHQGSSTKRYMGGTAQSLWSYNPQNAQSVPLDPDYLGTSKSPMVVGDQIYLASDRDGVMNLWRMELDGSNVQQMTHHPSHDVQSPSHHGDSIVYQHGADIWRFDISTAETSLIPISISSDLDQTREKWFSSPYSLVTHLDLSPDGETVALTARGAVFSVPVDGGRIATIADDADARYREASFLPTTSRIVALSDKSGELEFESLSQDGLSKEKSITDDGEVFRSDMAVSPTGERVAYVDKNYRLFSLDVRSGKSTLITQSPFDAPFDLTWSPNGEWLTYSLAAENGHTQIWLYEVHTKSKIAATSDRVYSNSPTWSRDGDWLFFLSDRHLTTSVESPWGRWQPEPYVVDTTQVFALALKKDTRPPWLKKNEVENTKKDPIISLPPSDDDTASTDDTESAQSPAIQIDRDGLSERIHKLSIAPGEYHSLVATSDALFWLEDDETLSGRCFDESDCETVWMTYNVESISLAAASDHLLVAKSNAYYVVPATPKKLRNLSEHRVPLSNWQLNIDPKAEWRQIFQEAWRLERDFFYDPNMHGTDWDAILVKYSPLVERVTTREELSNLIAQMVGELSALHIFVRGGDTREAPDSTSVPSLGASLKWSDRPAGMRIMHIYSGDQDYQDTYSSLDGPLVDAQEGDIITHVNGQRISGPTTLASQLRGTANSPVRLKLRRGLSSHETMVTPMAQSTSTRLRYDDWEEQRRLIVEAEGEQDIGYIHLRAMGGDNYEEWMQGYFPNVNRRGLIIDVRHNRGGNIDSWLLEKLMRTRWFYWQGHAGGPSPSMPHAFAGHIVVLVDAHTASDGEAFAEGVRRLGLGTIIGTRTWGGEIWLSYSNWLVDKGIASAAEWGVFGTTGEWLIEGEGVIPDIIVDNEPHATFTGEDAQLQAAIAHLKQSIVNDPPPAIQSPAYPNKSLEQWRKENPSRP